MLVEVVLLMEKNMSIEAKVKYVKSQTQTREHTCHWPKCGKQVKPAEWGCKTHWFKLPKDLRHKVWTHYNIGQEIRGTPSRKYLDVAKEVQDWIASQDVK
mgnify:CR=1 FL=1